jgi:O-antigen biosynthesis protein
MQDKYSREHLNKQNDSLYFVALLVKEGKKVLDVGCYQGALGNHLIKNKNCIVDGIEYIEEAAKEAKKSYRQVFIGDLNNDQIDVQDKYDYIVFADVLEHLISPEIILNKFTNYLNYGGEIIISVPNIGYEGIIASLASGEFEYNNTGILDRTHLKFFTKKSILSLIVNIGGIVNSVDEVKLPLIDSEFSKYINSKNYHSFDNLIKKFPNSNVYQYVISFSMQSHNAKNKKINKSYSVNTISKSQYKAKLYYKLDNVEFDEKHCKSEYINFDEEKSTLQFEIDCENYGNEFRFDPCEEGSFTIVNLVSIKNKESEIEIKLYDILPSNEQTKIFIKDNSLVVFSNGSDPSISFKINSELSEGDRIFISFSRLSDMDEIYSLLNSAQEKCNHILNSNSWKITAPIRLLVNFISRLVKVIYLIVSNLKKINLTNSFVRFIKSIKKYGLINSLKKVKKKLLSSRNYGLSNEERYKRFIVSGNIKLDKEYNKSVSLLSNVQKFSIVLPVYNTDINLLSECIESVISQSYINWELCICDDCSTDHNIKKLLDSYINKDERIKCVYAKENGHISKSSNKALSIATGDYVVLLDHDDLLHKHALFKFAYELENDPTIDLMYTDEDHITVAGERLEPFFKPSWSPALLLQQNYIGHLVCAKKALLEAVGNFAIGKEGAQDYDLLLKITDISNNIKHIPHILYHWREHPNSTALNSDSKPYAHTTGKLALQDFLTKKYGDEFVSVNDGHHLFTYKPIFKEDKSHKISIIIPIRDKIELLKNLIDSIFYKTSYDNYEIIIVDNGSVEEITKEYLNKIVGIDNVSIVNDQGTFNWSRVNNLGVQHATGDVYVFLNNDTLVISEDWLEQLSTWALLPDVGCVGPKLLYEDDTIQHAGIIIGLNHWADHIFKGCSQTHRVGPFVSSELTRNVLAVTGACQVISADKFHQLGLFDENFEICGSDVELCIRAYNQGLYNVYLANCKLYHLESKSRTSYIPGNDFNLSAIKYEPFRTLICDPFFNDNLDKFSCVPKVKND